MFFPLQLSYVLLSLLLLGRVHNVSAGYSPYYAKSLQHSHQHHHTGLSKLNGYERYHPRDVFVKRNTTSYVEELKSEITAFDNLMTTWFVFARTTANYSQIAQVHDIIHAHQAWFQQWFDGAPQDLKTSQLCAENVTFAGWMSALYDSVNVTSPEASIQQLQNDVKAYEGWIKSWLISALTTTIIDRTLPTSTMPYYSIASTPLQPIPTKTQAPDSRPYTTNTIIETTSAFPSFSSSLSLPSSTTAFNPRATDNVAVYFGQTDQTGNVTLKDICTDNNVNIVIVAFVNGFFNSTTGGGYPTVNFGAAGGNPDATMLANNASGLLWCPDLASQIQGCQDAGKIVLLSLGGSIANSTFTDDNQSEVFAGLLWDMFGNSTHIDPAMRPFGQVVVDGFDIDNESKNTTGYLAFAEELRSQMSKDSSKPYYLSAAPQCPRPDASIPLEVMTQLDFVWVQFYNNPSCDIGTPGFLPSFNAWSDDLNDGTRPMLYVGVMAEAADGIGYANLTVLQGAIRSIRSETNVSSFGGVNLWDGSQAVASGNLQDWVKEYLTEPLGG